MNIVDIAIDITLDITVDITLDIIMKLWILWTLLLLSLYPTVLPSDTLAQCQLVTQHTPSTHTIHSHPPPY